MASSKPQEVQISTLEKLALFPIVLKAFGSAALSAVSYCFYSAHSRPNTYGKWIIYSAMRTLFASLNSEQENWISPTTQAGYTQYCTGKRVPGQVEDIGNSTQVFWIGEKTAQKIMLFFHGGGYALPGGIDQFLALHDLVETTKPPSGPNFAILFLDYDTTPQAKYPHQLSQAVQLLSYALINLKYSPENIILGGDSAGANLTMALLGHLLHPHPQHELVPKIPLLGGSRFRGVMVLSPWITFSTSADSFKRNATKDLCTTTALDRWSKSFMGDAKEDPYNQPLSAPEGWWASCSGIVQDVFIGGGKDEVMIDDIVALGKQIKKEWKGGDGVGGVEVVVVPDEAHDSFFADRLFKYIQMKVEVRTWMKKILA